MLSDRLDSAALVVAHPDDEILWFSSVLDRIAHIYICYLDVPGQEAWTSGRRTLAQNFPLENVTFIGLTESVSFRGADWSNPVETDAGLEVNQRPGTLPGFSAERYSANFDLLVQQLRGLLAGYRVVLTHNPWGEYGNEEHVQVHRAVDAAREHPGYEIWCPNYCSDRTYPLMLRHIRGRRSDCETLPTNLTLAHQIEQLYRQHGCWTWPFDDYAYFSSESFFRAGSPPSDTPRGSTLPLNYIGLYDVAPAAGNHGSLLSPRAIMRRAHRWIRARTG